MEKLKELRKNLKIKQQDIADYLKISRQAYSHYENGQRQPTPETLQKLADYFGVSVDYLLGRDINPIMDRPESQIVENFINQYSYLFSEKEFRAYTELYSLMNETQKIFILGTIIGYLREKGVKIDIKY